MKALLYLFLLLGSSLAMASEESHAQGFSADQICDFAYPVPDQVPLSGGDQLSLPVARNLSLLSSGTPLPLFVSLCLPQTVVFTRPIRAPPAAL